MPPRYAYWTILVDGQPTAFRAAEPDELLPTLKRLQVKQPTATMKWFQRGRLWESKEDAKDKLDQGYTVSADGTLLPPDGTAGRGKGWRPGGEHKDPREKYQLAKKAKWQKFKQMVRARPGHGPKTDEAGVDAPMADDATLLSMPDDPALDDASFGAGFEDVTAEYESGGDASGHDGASEDESGAGNDAPETGSGDATAPATDWRGRPKSEGAAPPAPAQARSDRPKAGGYGGRPKPAWRDKPGGGSSGGWKPRTDARGPKPEWKPRTDARGPRPEWKARPEGGGGRPVSDRPKPAWRDKPGGDRPYSDRPKPASRDKPGGGSGGWKPGPNARGPKPEWRDKPAGAARSRDDAPRGDRPFSDRPKPAWRDKPGASSGGGWKPRPDARGPKPAWRDKPAGAGRLRDDAPRSDRPFSDRPKPAWRDKPAGAAPSRDDAPRSDRPFSDRPKPAWRDKPGGTSGGGWKPRAEGGGAAKPAWKKKPAGGRPSGPPKRRRE